MKMMDLASRGGGPRKPILAKANLGQAVDFVWVSESSCSSRMGICLAPAFLIPALLPQIVHV